ncbi:hypothetical protein Adt_42834 [Abeliophyllum distichum]|uniref:Uncharacterized protein n=1 Tax=Abeliophyllum distichum TaxID=126358 RepID=A0ABD1PST0_9LAMI
MTCSECGLQGHNKRYHLRHGAPGNDWFNAQLDPMENDIELPLDSRKKVNMSTGQREGPSASSLHVVKGHDKGKTIVDDIRMEEIDTSPMVEDLERLNAEETTTTRAIKAGARSQINTRSSRFVPPRAR